MPAPPYAPALANNKPYIRRASPDIIAWKRPPINELHVMKNLVALLLLISPWAIFVYAAQSTGTTNTFVLLLTLAVSAFGFTLLISGKKK
jgi:uncharacterized membrane protein